MNFRVLKEKGLFYFSDPEGNLPDPAIHPHGYGLFFRDTRALSRWELSVSPIPFELLLAEGSSNFACTYRLTNRAAGIPGQTMLPEHSLHLTRRQLVDGDHFLDVCVLENYSKRQVMCTVTYQVAADFWDMFAVRGFLSPNAQPAPIVSTDPADRGVRFHAVAADDTVYTTTVRISNPEPSPSLSANPQVTQMPHRTGTWRLTIPLAVPPGSRVSWEVTVEHQQDQLRSDTALSIPGSGEPRPRKFRDAEHRMREAYKEWRNRAPRIRGPEPFVRWYEQGLLDIRMLLDDVGHGPFPVAGVPWYAVPFGRDSLWTALELLIASPEIARGTLRTLATFQGTRLDPGRDEEPGKIMHELRFGEWARTGVVPFRPYYGTIDATPLFLILAAEYLHWTGDEPFFVELEPHVRRGFEWIEQHGDRDGDRFLEYGRKSSKGLSHQGWKDSEDGIVDPDGNPVPGPIALCEVQGYVYAAYRSWRDLYAYFGDFKAAAHCGERAEALRQQFLDHYWLPKKNLVALALDGRKTPVATAASNMGHVLLSGILPQEIGHRVTDRLLAEDLFSGFGIRTLSKAERGYNPLSYHRGSVWPHDTMITLAGAKRYGRHDAVSQILRGLLRAAESFSPTSLPELFAGYGTEETPIPVPYPVSCAPQAWASGAAVWALQILLGLRPNALSGTIELDPHLPKWMDRLEIAGIRVGRGMLSLLLSHETSGRLVAEVLENSTGLDLHWPISQDILVRRNS